MLKAKVIAWMVTVILIAVIMTMGVSVIAGTGKLPEPRIYLTVEKGQVWRKPALEAEFVEVYVQAKLNESDTVRTGAGGQAKITFYDSQEMIVDENTDLVLTKGFIDAQNPFVTKVKVNLLNGQVWSRLLELLHPDAVFEVESGAVVATVRGTSFNAQKTAEAVVVSVYENKVEMRLIEKDKKLAEVKSGETFSYQSVTGDLTVEKSKDRSLRSGVAADEWLMQNILRDSEFHNNLRAARRKLIKPVGSLPGERLYRIKLFIEKMGVRLLGAERLSATLINKRAAEAAACIDGSARGGLRLAIENNMAKNYNFLRLQAMNPDFRSWLAKQPMVRQYFYDQVFDADQQKFVAAKIEKTPGYTNDDPVLEVEGANAPVETSSTPLTAQPTAEPFAADKTLTKEQDMNGEIVPPADEKNNLINNETIKQSDANDTVAPIAPPTIKLEAPAPKVVEQKQLTNKLTLPVTPQSLSVTSSQANLTAGEKTVLTAYLVYSDKTQKDVTTESSWSLGTDDLTGRYAGSLAKNVFIANDEGGKAYVTATYRTSDGKSFTGKITLTVLVLQ